MACKLYVYVAPSEDTPGSFAVYQKRPGKARHEYRRFKKPATARALVRAMMQHEGACFVPTKSLRRPGAKR